MKPRITFNLSVEDAEAIATLIEEKGTTSMQLTKWRLRKALENKERRLFEKLAKLKI